MIELAVIKRTDPRLLANMKDHYSSPKGFVGRNICYAVMVSDVYYGAIVGGSTPKHLPGRGEIRSLNMIVNNLFFSCERPVSF